MSKLCFANDYEEYKPFVKSLAAETPRLTMIRGNTVDDVIGVLGDGERLESQSTACTASPRLRGWAVLPDVDGGSRDRVSATELTLWAGFRRVASLVDSRT